MNDFLDTRLGLLCFLLTAILLRFLFGVFSDWREVQAAKEEARIHKELTGEDLHYETFIHRD